MATHLRRQNLLFAAIAFGSVTLTSFVGQLATHPNLEPWYAGLIKPNFNPPNWVFAPVWTSLFVLMAVAVWRIFRVPENTPGRRLALILFFTQLAMNAAWSWMFFGMQSPMLGMINIVPQLVLIAATTVVFFRLDKVAGRCLIPLIAWVSFASVLNFEILRLNG